MVISAKSIVFTLPLIVFSFLVGLFFIGLGDDPRELPSPFIGKPAPAFTLRMLGGDDRLNPVEMFKGKPWILNVWASWCVACRVEHPVFISMRAANQDVILVGLNYKDDRTEARQWLEQLGNPYTFSVEDTDGLVGIDWGVYAVPETFIIDAQGFIRYKHIGPVSKQLMDETMLPMLIGLEQS